MNFILFYRIFLNELFVHGHAQAGAIRDQDLPVGYFCWFCDQFTQQRIEAFGIFQRQHDLTRFLPLFLVEQLVPLRRENDPRGFVSNFCRPNGRVRQPQRHLVPAFDEQVDADFGGDADNVLLRGGLAVDLRDNRPDRRLDVLNFASRRLGLSWLRSIWQRSQNAGRARFDKRQTLKAVQCTKCSKDKVCVHSEHILYKEGSFEPSFFYKISTKFWTSSFVLIA